MINKVDYLGQVGLSKSILNNMIARKTGTFINISSAAGILGFPLRSAYCGAKWGMLGYFESLRVECASHGINVTNICPGFISTEVAKNSLAGGGDRFGKQDPDIENGMPAPKCAKMILNAASNKIPEAWIALPGKLLTMMYLYTYTPWLA